MSGAQDGVECLQVLGELRRIYNLIEAIGYSQQLVRRHKTESEAFVVYLEEKYIWLHEKAVVLYPNAHNQLSRGLHKYLHELEELLRSAQELLNDLAEPFKLFTRAVERFHDLRENIEKTLAWMEILLQFAPPEELSTLLNKAVFPTDHFNKAFYTLPSLNMNINLSYDSEPVTTLPMARICSTDIVFQDIIDEAANTTHHDAYGKPMYNVGLYDPIPEKWYEPPPAAEILLETKTANSRGGAGQPAFDRALTWRTWRVLNEIQHAPQLFSDLFSYVDNSSQLTLMVNSLKTLVPVEGDVHHVTSPYLQTMLSEPDRE